MEPNTPTMTKIAVGVDGSPASDRALLWARSCATATGADLTLVELPSAPGVRYLECELARSLECELVVVATAHRSRLGELMLGSSSRWLLNHSRGALAVVPHDWTPTTHQDNPRVVVGYDTSPHSLHALQWTLRHLSNSPTVVHVFDPRQVRNFGPNHDQLDRARLRSLNEVDTALASADIPRDLRRIFCEGRPSEVLALAEDCDTVVVSAGSTDRFPRIGSVALQTVRRARVPVIVVR